MIGDFGDWGLGMLEIVEAGNWGLREITSEVIWDIGDTGCGKLGNPRCGK